LGVVGLDAVQFHHLDERDDTSPCGGAFVAAGDQRAFSRQGNWPGEILDTVALSVSVSIWPDRPCDGSGRRGPAASSPELVADRRQAGSPAKARLGGCHFDGVGLLLGYEQPLLPISFIAKTFWTAAARTITSGTTREPVPLSLYRTTGHTLSVVIAVSTS